MADWASLSDPPGGGGSGGSSGGRGGTPQSDRLGFLRTVWDHILNAAGSEGQRALAQATTNTEPGLRTASYLDAIDDTLRTGLALPSEVLWQALPLMSNHTTSASGTQFPDEIDVEALFRAATLGADPFSAVGERVAEGIVAGEAYDPVTSFGLAGDMAAGLASGLGGPARIIDDAVEGIARWLRGTRRFLPSAAESVRAAAMNPRGGQGVVDDAVNVFGAQQLPGRNSYELRAITSQGPEAMPATVTYRLDGDRIYVEGIENPDPTNAHALGGALHSLFDLADAHGAEIIGTADAFRSKRLSDMELLDAYTKHYGFELATGVVPGVNWQLVRRPIPTDDALRDAEMAARQQRMARVLQGLEEQPSFDGVRRLAYDLDDGLHMVLDYDPDIGSFIAVRSDGMAHPLRSGFDDLAYYMPEGEDIRRVVGEDEWGLFLEDAMRYTDETGGLDADGFITHLTDGWGMTEADALSVADATETLLKQAGDVGPGNPWGLTRGEWYQPNFLASAADEAIPPQAAPYPQQIAGAAPEVADAVREAGESGLPGFAGLGGFGGSTEQAVEAIASGQGRLLTEYPELGVAEIERLIDEVANSSSPVKEQALTRLYDAREQAVLGGDIASRLDFPVGVPYSQQLEELASIGASGSSLDQANYGRAVGILGRFDVASASQADVVGWLQAVQSLGNGRARLAREVLSNWGQAPSPELARSFMNLLMSVGAESEALGGVAKATTALEALREPQLFQSVMEINPNFISETLAEVSRIATEQNRLLPEVGNRFGREYTMAAEDTLARLNRLVGELEDEVAARGQLDAQFDQMASSLGVHTSQAGFVAEGISRIQSNTGMTEESIIRIIRTGSTDDVASLGRVSGMTPEEFAAFIEAALKS